MTTNHLYQIRVTEPSGVIWDYYMEVDLAQASDTIAVGTEPDELEGTPYQTADARHRAMEAARVAYQWLTREDLQATHWDDVDIEIDP